MQVNDHNVFRKFEYENAESNPNFKLGEVVIKVGRIDEIEEDGNPIGVVIQIHDDGDCRTDMFGNCCSEEVRLATYEEILKYRVEVLNHIDLFNYYEILPDNVQAIINKYSKQENDYKSCEKMSVELIAVGYTMEFGLDAEPYNLQKIIKTYKIPIIYQRMEFIEVIADNLQKATTQALNEFLSIPDEHYLCDSFEVDDIYLKENYPNEKIERIELNVDNVKLNKNI